MKIAIWHNLPSGGGKRALYNHIKALKANGHYLEAWTTDCASIEYLPLSELITEHRLPLKEQLTIIGRTKSSVRRVVKTISVLKDHSRICAEEIKKKGFDLILANSCALSYMPYISLFAKIPVLVYLGEPNRLFYEANEIRNIWELPPFRFTLKGINRFRKDLFRIYSLRLQLTQELKAARACTRILVNSFFSRESIKKAYGLESEVCYLGIDENLFQNIQLGTKLPYVVGLGRISEAKNVRSAILAIAHIPQAKRPVLKWISNGFAQAYFEAMKSLARELMVDFIPCINVSDETLVKLLSEASVMVYTPNLEPFGLAPLEANACGTFVVAVSEGGVRESIESGENGFLVNGNHPEAIAEIILTFISDTYYAKDMGLKARRHALKYWNWRQMSDNIENAVQSVMR